MFSPTASFDDLGPAAQEVSEDFTTTFVEGIKVKKTRLSGEDRSSPGTRHCDGPATINGDEKSIGLGHYEKMSAGRKKDSGS